MTATGNYSEYGSQTSQTYLRGIQTTDANGQVSVMTIYPGWYQGRATHIHIEVTMGGRSVKVTQIAFPETINNAVYATSVMRRAAAIRRRTCRTVFSRTAFRRSWSHRAAIPRQVIRRRIKSESLCR
jgi:protocatechuate 3,4-dioxygenase beta subunit